MRVVGMAAGSWAVGSTHVRGGAETWGGGCGGRLKGGADVYGLVWLGVAWWSVFGVAAERSGAVVVGRWRSGVGVAAVVAALGAAAVVAAVGVAGGGGSNGSGGVGGVVVAVWWWWRRCWW